MQQTCPRCGSVIDAQSRFCTNCGAVRETTPRYRQSWEASDAVEAGIPGVPASTYPGQDYQGYQATGGAYQQQNMMGNQNTGGSLGFGGQSDATVKKLLLILGAAIAGVLLLLVLCITLAIVVPVSGIRVFFVIVALLLILIPWIIYSRIRHFIRRRVGNFWRFL